MSLPPCAPNACDVSCFIGWVLADNIDRTNHTIQGLAYARACMGITRDFPADSPDAHSPAENTAQQSERPRIGGDPSEVGKCSSNIDRYKKGATRWMLKSHYRGTRPAQALARANRAFGGKPQATLVLLSSHASLQASEQNASAPIGVETTIGSHLAVSVNPHVAHLDGYVFSWVIFSSFP